MPRIVAVFGATGTQGTGAIVTEPLIFTIDQAATGSAVVNALLEDKTFVPRAITRNASSDAAKALATRGAEVVTGDLWDKESIKKALTGCEAVFGVIKIRNNHHLYVSDCMGRSQTTTTRLSLVETPLVRLCRAKFSSM